MIAKVRHKNWKGWVGGYKCWGGGGGGGCRFRGGVVWGFGETASREKKLELELTGVHDEC